MSSLRPRDIKSENRLLLRTKYCVAGHAKNQHLLQFLSNLPVIDRTFDTSAYLSFSVKGCERPTPPKKELAIYHTHTHTHHVDFGVLKKGIVILFIIHPCTKYVEPHRQWDVEECFWKWFSWIKVPRLFLRKKREEELLLVEWPRFFIIYFYQFSFIVLCKSFYMHPHKRNHSSNELQREWQ